MNPYTPTHRLRGLQLDGLRRFLPRSKWRYRLDSGQDFVLHSGDKLSELIFTGRAYEPLESNFCLRYLQPGDVAYDVGANVGYFSTLFSRAVGDMGLVVAMEPGRHTFELLSQTLARLELQNVVALPVALWSRSEVLSFHCSRAGDDAQQSVARRGKHGNDVVLMPVPALSFGDLMASGWFQAQREPALIKIDVEGAESQVVEGLNPLFESTTIAAPTLLIECNAEALRAMGNDPVHLLQSLTKWYELFATPLCWPPWYAKESRFLPLGDPRGLAVDAELNIVAVPRAGANRERALRALG